MTEIGFAQLYPKFIVEKYRTVLPAYGDGLEGYIYQGPTIKTSVVACCAQNFAVYAEPEHHKLYEFKSRNGDEAFIKAVEAAEARGLPWKDDLEIFDPVTATRWSYSIITKAG